MRAIAGSEASNSSDSSKNESNNRSANKEWMQTKAETLAAAASPPESVGKVGNNRETSNLQQGHLMLDARNCMEDNNS
jgi:hypothetical protein